MNGVLTQITAPKTIEDYMEKHDFIPADRYKVRQLMLFISPVYNENQTKIASVNS